MVHIYFFGVLADRICMSGIETNKMNFWETKFSTIERVHWIDSDTYTHRNTYNICWLMRLRDESKVQNLHTSCLCVLGKLNVAVLPVGIFHILIYRKNNHFYVLKWYCSELYLLLECTVKHIKRYMRKRATYKCTWLALISDVCTSIK